MFELKLTPTSKKSMDLKVNESYSFEEDFDAEFAIKFKNLFSTEFGKKTLLKDKNLNLKGKSFLNKISNTMNAKDMIM